MTRHTNLVSLLRDLAENGDVDHGVFTYGPGVVSEGLITYRDLYDLALERAKCLMSISQWIPRCPVLLIFTRDRTELLWFWAALLANLVPVSFPGRSRSLRQQMNSWTHLRQLLKEPLVLSDLPSDELDLLASHKVFSTVSMSLLSELEVSQQRTAVPNIPNEIAYLGLTSGSTASAKAVPIAHSRAIYNAFERTRSLGHGSNCVVLDTISSAHFSTAFCSSMLSAYVAGGSVVYINTEDAITRPVDVFRVMTKHGVTHWYEPNSRMVIILDKVQKALNRGPLADIDLSKFCVMTLAGDRAQTRRCVQFNELLHGFGAPPKTVISGFGMTEMHGAYIAATHYLRRDFEDEVQFLSTGRPMPGLDVRILDDEGVPAPTNQIGYLEVKSKSIFTGYFNNEAQTFKAFTKDGWFKTLDLAITDEEGIITVLGRSGDMINCQSDTFFPPELETILKESNIACADPSTFTVVKHYDDVAGSDVAIVLFSSSDDAKFNQQAKQINDALAPIMQWNVYDVLTVDPEIVKRNPRGKINRNALSSQYQRGELKYVQSTRVLN